MGAARTVCSMAALALLVAGPAAAAAGPAEPAAGARLPGLTASFEELDAFVEARAEAAGLPGIAYGIAQDGVVVHTAAFGVAGPDGRPMTTTTALNTASVGKTFTALAVAQLAAGGAIDLDTPVQTYVPEFDLADHEAAARITVRHLLTHTSGLSTLDGNRPWLLNTDATVADLVARMATLRPDRPVGGAFEYSNVNYVLLGAVVEAVTGQGYHEYLSEHVLAPLGMDSTFRTAADARAAGLDVADGYRYLYGLPVADDVPMPLGAEAAGMQWTTIEDLATYAAAFADHGAVDGRSLVTGEATSTPDYDVDWLPAAWAPDDGFGHAGGWITYSSGLEVLPGHRFAVVTLANANPAQGFPAESTFDIAFDTMRVAHGWPAQMERTSVRTFYAWADALVLFLLAAVAWRWWRSRTWRVRFEGASTWRRRRMLVGWALVDLALPVGLLLALPPALTGLPLGEAWVRLMTALPDAVGVVVTLGTALTALGALKAVVMVRAFTRRRPHPAPGPAAAPPVAATPAGA